jgi:hypothetical protein
MNDELRARIVIGFMLTTVVVGLYAATRGWLGWVPIEDVVGLVFLTTILLIARDVYTNVLS